jgi:hypothetical protein
MTPFIKSQKKLPFVSDERKVSSSEANFYNQERKIKKEKKILKNQGINFSLLPLHTQA